MFNAKEVYQQLYKKMPFFPKILKKKFINDNAYDLAYVKGMQLYAKRNVNNFT